MTEREIDPERLAALLDGKLSEAEATVVRRQLAEASDDTLSAYADAVAVTRALEGQTGAKGGVEQVASIETRRRRSHWRWMVPAAAAAAIATIVVWRPTRGVDAYAPSRFAAAVPASAAAVTVPAWSVTRGAGDGLSEQARATRIGAVLVDLEIDVNRGASTREHTLMLASLVGAGSGGAPLRTTIESIPADSMERLPKSRLTELGQQAIALVDPDYANAGAYLEAARIATTAGDTNFFNRHPTSSLTKLAGNATLDPSARQSIGRIDSLATARPRDSSVLNAAVTEALRSLAR